jgi:UDP-GlcNAc3NAcA epimerase
MKIVSVVGARPQFIKCAPVSRALRAVATEVLVHTGQHYNATLSDVFFRDLRLPEPDYHLGVGSGSHGWQTGEMLKHIEKVIDREKPDCVLVYGDTNSTLAGALAASKSHIPLAHVEAGLRSYNRRMPEEINRVLTDHVSRWLFCPCDNAVRNLAREGITSGVHAVGDVMYDALLEFVPAAEAHSKILQALNLRPGGYALATIHRAENADDSGRLEAIGNALGAIRDLGLPVLLPLHPRTQSRMRERRLDFDSVRVIEPVSYLDMIALEKQARVILTDSGGVQKEAFWLRVPCVTLREETEWVETIQTGRNVLAGVNHERILAAVRAAAAPSPPPPSVYGDGHAASRIANILEASARDPVFIPPL